MLLGDHDGEEGVDLVERSDSADGEEGTVEGGDGVTPLGSIVPDVVVLLWGLLTGIVDMNEGKE